VVSEEIDPEPSTTSRELLNLHRTSVGKLNDSIMAQEQGKGRAMPAEGNTMTTGGSAILVDECMDAALQFRRRVEAPRRQKEQREKAIAAQRQAEKALETKAHKMAKDEMDERNAKWAEINEQLDAKARESPRKVGVSRRLGALREMMAKGEQRINKNK
jgi:hypothetical protein